jgi:hypothetical protein
MKKQILLIVCLFFSVSIFAQLFKASVRNTGSNLEVYMTVYGTGDITTGFSQIEFFIRTPSTTPAFNVGSVIVNSAAFPGSIPIVLSNDNTSGGYRTMQFGYAPTNSGSSFVYLNGVEYLLATIPLSGGPVGQTGDFEIVHDNATFSTYINVTSDIGVDLSYATCIVYGTCPGEHVFYGTTAVNSNIYTALISNVPLPLELLSFSLETKQNSIQLNWTSLNEISFSGYELQRSTNGKDFEDINWQLGIGGKNVQLYSYDDVSVQKNVLYYYRLKMIDDQDLFEYSNVLSGIIHGDDSDFRIYPNPASDLFTLEVFTPKDRAQIIIYDNLGKEVSSYNIDDEGMNKLTLSSGNFSKGVYQVILRRNNEVSQVKQLVIVK